MTGQTLTQAVTTALRERLARIEQPDALAEDLLALGRDCAARLQGALGAAPITARFFMMRRACRVDYRRVGAHRASARGSGCASALRARCASRAEPKRMSAANFLQTAIVIDGSRDPIASRRLDELITKAGIEIEPVTAEQAQIARAAYRDFGKGGHPAGLNFGDCFAYALAKVTAWRAAVQGERLRADGLEGLGGEVAPLFASVTAVVRKSRCAADARGRETECEVLTV